MGDLIGILVSWLVMSVALLITAYFVPGFKIKSFRPALVAAVVIGLINVFIRPILVFLTMPLNILTLGLFTFVINAFLLKLSAAIVKDFEIEGWGAAILGAIVLAVINFLLHIVF